MKGIQLGFFLLFFLVLAGDCAAQIGGINVYDRNRNQRNYDNYDAIEKYFRLEAEKNGLNDSIPIPDEELLTPEELRKLGVPEDVIEQIEELSGLQDTLDVTQKKMREDLLRERYGEDYVDSLSVNEIKDALQQRKREIIEKALELPQVLVYGHGFFRKSNLKFLFDRKLDEKIPDDYVIGPGDELNITTWGNDYTTNELYQVDQDGAIFPEDIGRIVVAGLTYSEVTQFIRTRYAIALQVEENTIFVSMSFARNVSANFVGELLNPGTYRFPARTTVFNALGAIDGPDQLGSVRNIHVKRNGQTVKFLDVYEYMTDPNSNQEFFLEENDYVVVPTMGPVVHIDGEIRRPFNYEILEGEGLRDVIKYAGGLQGGAYTRNISIKRYANNEEQLVDVNLDSLQKYNFDFELMNGDSITVNRIPRTLRNYVEVIGAVKVPGKYEVKKGDRISDIIDRAEGLVSEANLQRSYVIRIKDDRNKKLIPFSLDEIFENRYSEQNILLQNMDTVQIISWETSQDRFEINISGAVRQPGTYEFAEGLTLKDLLFWSGGLRKEAANNRIEVSRIVSFEEEELGDTRKNRIIVKRLEINPDLSIDIASEQFELKPEDHIFVRTSRKYEEQQIIKLYGEITYPGEYTLLNKEERVSSLVERAGGFTNFAFKSGSRLYRIQDSTGFVLMDLSKRGQDNDINEPTGFFKFLQFKKRKRYAMRDDYKKYDYILSDGDSIYIPEVKNYVTLAGAMGHFEIDTATQVSVPFEKGKRADYYVRKYGGGFSRFAKRSRTYVRQANGETDKANFKFLRKDYPIVDNGALIVVDITDRKRFEEFRIERKKEKNWNDAFDSVTAKVATVATIVLLIFQIRGNGN